MDNPIPTPILDNEPDILDLATFTLQYIADHKIEDPQAFLMCVLSRTVH